MAKDRLIYLDNLRVFLTFMVVLFHLAITYGFDAGWYFYDSSDDVVTKVVLTYFILVNQAYFMSLFFSVAGYFTPASYDRKGSSLFLKDRFLRLGIPLLLFVFIMDPLLSYVYNNHTNISFLGYISTEIKTNPAGLILQAAPGPMWFVEALLIFSICYVIFRIALRAKKITFASHFPSDKTILLFVITLSILNFIIRIWSPVGKQIIFLQLGHFAPYIGYFIVGILAYRFGWLENLTNKQAKKWLSISIICILLFPVLLYIGGAFEGQLLLFVGGWHWQSLLYSFWEPFVCIGISMELLNTFRSRFNEHNRWTRYMADHAYTVYFNHALIAVYFSLFFQQVTMYPLLKFVTASIIVIILCFLAAYLIKRIPHLRKIF